MTSPAQAVRSVAAMSQQGAAPGRSAAPFGAALEPVLRQACADRLSAISWFRTDWQRGGALTGYATYRDDDQREQPVVVKLPVPPVERLWLQRLQDAADVAPRLWAHGDTLGGYDLAWVVMERLGHGPLGPAWGAAAFDLLADAAARFSAAASLFAVTGQPPQKDWRAIHAAARDSVQRDNVANGQRWSKALKKAQRRLNEWLAAWQDRPTDDWCHGDLHPANALTRNPPPDGPAVLIDYAEVRRGHWVEDAVYFEHLFWSRRERLEGRKLVKVIARQRKALGLAVESDWPRLAAIKRTLLAMSTPVVLRHAGDPQHVQAALELLEHEVG